MRVLSYVSALCILGVARCGILTTNQILPTAVTTSQRIGGNFAYSTVESAAVPSIVHPVSYAAAAPLTAVAQPLYTHQSIFGSPFFNPIISSPFYPGIIGQAPIVGQFPGQGQVPVQAPVVAPPQGPQGAAPPPPGAVVDDDTVSVESA